MDQSLISSALVRVKRVPFWRLVKRNKQTKEEMFRFLNDENGSKFTGSCLPAPIVQQRSRSETI